MAISANAQALLPSHKKLALHSDLLCYSTNTLPPRGRVFSIEEGACLENKPKSRKIAIGNAM